MDRPRRRGPRSLRSGRFGDVEDLHQGVAHGRSVTGRQPVDGVVQGCPVRGRGDQRDRLRRERDQPDPDVLGQLVDEGARRSAGRVQPSRRDIGRTHRARDVHRQDDRRVLARDRHDHGRTGEADEQRRDRPEIEHRRQMAAPGRPARGDVGQQVEVREADRIAAAPALRPKVEADDDRDQEQAEQEFRGEEGHDATPTNRAVRPSAARGAAPTGQPACRSCRERRRRVAWTTNTGRGPRRPDTDRAPARVGR